MSFRLSVYSSKRSEWTIRAMSKLGYCGYRVRGWLQVSGANILASTWERDPSCSHGHAKSNRERRSLSSGSEKRCRVSQAALSHAGDTSTLRHEAIA